MSTATLLSAAAAILATEPAWCIAAHARDENGIYCPPLSSRAVAWDLYGALLKAMVENSENIESLHGAYEHLRSKIPGPTKNKDIDLFNDTLTFAQVAPLFT